MFMNFDNLHFRLQILLYYPDPESDDCKILVAISASVHIYNAQIRKTFLSNVQVSVSVSFFCALEAALQWYVLTASREDPFVSDATQIG